MKRFSITAAAATVLAFAAGASAQEAAKLADVVIQGPTAQRAQEQHYLRADIAKQIAEACEALAHESNRAASVFILDQFGNIIHSHRMDGHVAINIETALMKARSALYTRAPTSLLLNRARQDPFARLMHSQLGLFTNTGGLPIIVEGQLLGAIGVGGWGGEDEACAHHALTEVLGPQPPRPEALGVDPEIAERGRAIRGH